MARLVCSVLCEKAVEDRHDNSVHLQGTIETIVALEPPPDPVEDGMHLRLQVSHAVFCLWVRSDLSEPETTMARIRLLCPDGQEHIAAETTIDLERDKRARTHVRATELPFHGFGEYQYTIEEKPARARRWHVLATIPFELQLADNPPQNKKTSTKH